MSRVYYSKTDMIEIYLRENETFELSLFCLKPKRPHLFNALFLGYDDEAESLHYQVQGNPEQWVNLKEVVQIGKDCTYSALAQ